MSLVDRPNYVSWLERWRGHDLVKVLTGVRRCGKSTILQLYRTRLLDQGVPASHILNFNLEDPDSERDFASDLRLYEHVKRAASGAQPCYVFIDEAQHLAEFERTIAGLASQPNIDVYVTGSNSDFLSGDLATRLTGRYVERHVLPLSYVEYSAADQPETARPGAAPTDPWANYVRHGGFPYVTRLGGDVAMIQQYLSSVVNTIVLKDVAPRQTSFTPALFDGVLEFMMDNIGNLTNIKRVSDTLTSTGRKTGRSAVEHYIDGLVASFLLYRVPRFDIKGKVYLENSAKYYAVDPGVRRALLGGQCPDWGNLLENIVFLELLRRGHRVSVGKVGQTEIDFIAESDGTRAYFQVSQRAESPESLTRELAPLRAAPDHYPRWLLVGHDGPACPMPASSRCPFATGCSAGDRRPRGRRR